MRKQFLLAICLLVGITGVLAEVRSSDVIIENLCKQGERCMDEAKYDSSFYFYNAALSQNGVKSTDWYAKIINGRGLLYYTTGDMDSALADKLEAVRLLNRKEHPDLEGWLMLTVRSALFIVAVRCRIRLLSIMKKLWIGREAWK